MLVPANKPKGFTLIELVIGIVLFSIVLVIVTSLIIPQARRSVDPIMQVRAAELAQTMLSEIRSRSFDENSDRVNGLIRCGEDLIDDTAERGCTAEGDFGPDSESRSQFDDVDDYHGLNVIANSLGNNIEIGGVNLYQGFSISVTVEYANLGTVVDSKLITVTVTTPTGVDLVFSSYRSNF